MSDISLLVCGDVKEPQRKFGDAGIDFFVPNKSEQFIKDLNDCNKDYIEKGEILITAEGIFVYPGVDVKFPLYVKSKFPENRCLLAVNKSGIATKQKFIVGACLIDSTYQNYIHGNLFNVSKTPQLLKFGQKAIQFVPIKIDPEEVKVVSGLSADEFYGGKTTERGLGGFGSTGV